MDFNRGMAGHYWLASLIWWGWGWLFFGIVLIVNDISLPMKLLFTGINAALWMQSFMGWRHHLRVIEIKEYFNAIIDEIERKAVQP